MQAIPNFSCSYRVYWEDTDAGGVVYYANYLNFMERCRTDWLRHLGVNQHQLRRERQLQFAVASVAVKFIKPAVLDDEITVTAELARLGGATIEFRQAIWRAGVQLIDAQVRVACLDSVSLKPRGLPKDMFMEWRNAE
ncbi:MAG: tol-pal system-associated acyl-CoA thioesterase [Steroidobacterales bacterium]